jgi:hypothetical protein
VRAGREASVPGPSAPAVCARQLNQVSGEDLVRDDETHLATMLEVPLGTALQNIEEIDYSQSGTRVMLSSEWHVPGVFELRVNRRS